MVARVPDTPTPIGCLFGFFGLIATAYSVIAFWGAYKAFGLTPPESEIGMHLLKSGLIALIPAMAGVVYCIYRLATAGKREHYAAGQSLSN